MKAAILRYVLENYEDLLKLDMTIARLAGAPAPHTVSSYVYGRSKVLTFIIDIIFFWLKGEKHHCRNEHNKVEAAKDGAVGQ